MAEPSSKMTSFYARHGSLSRQTRELSQHFARPRNPQDRLSFYMEYLLDVVPLEVTVRHVPSSSATRARMVEREEIQLLTLSGDIFMTGLVGMGPNPNHCEEIAASEAYTKWLDGYFAADGRNWRFFTGLSQLRFYKSDGDDTWKITENFPPMDNAQRVSEFLQRQYESLGHN